MQADTDSASPLCPRRFRAQNGQADGPWKIGGSGGKHLLVHCSPWPPRSQRQLLAARPPGSSNAAWPLQAPSTAADGSDATGPQHHLGLAALPGPQRHQGLDALPVAQLSSGEMSCMVETAAEHALVDGAKKLPEEEEKKPPEEE